jgi:hypothetical protein
LWRGFGLRSSLFNWRVRRWWEHPEHVRLREKVGVSRAKGGGCPQWLVDEVKAEMARGEPLLLP